jgi:hypothetical protein
MMYKIDQSEYSLIAGVLSHHAIFQEGQQEIHDFLNHKIK